MTMTTARETEAKSTDADRTPHSATATLGDLAEIEARLDRRAIRRDGWTLSIFGVAIVGVIFSLIALGLSTRAVHESKRNVRSAKTAGAGAVTPATATPAAPPAAVSPIAVSLADYSVGLPSTTVAAGKVTLNIANAAGQQHELLVFKSDLAPSQYPMKDGDINEDGPGITKVSDGDNLDPGASQIRVVDFTTHGTYLLVCNLPGHYRLGMYRVVTVK